MWQSDLELAEAEANDRYSKNGSLADLADIGKDAPNQPLQPTTKSSGDTKAVHSV